MICWNFPLLLEGNKIDLSPVINYIPSCYSEATTQSPHLKKTVEYTIALNTVTYFPSVFYHLKKKKSTSTEEGQQHGVGQGYG